ncbi:hypothetical protein GGTG_13779 [Gaeumannomyces tritici R3-111a-1]|uniref:Amino acid transporter transmembrane domain-containing protein n=1 Tax=Gaeumannomyces tritici (strain R3-111a-1) TaxID=644352 RepID=J3PJT9_GAET3|nr:hypothetical protein GGTG_13779 [Gaeumannomyces tritici R3-111a-1]EJT68652.1 hypothetical protein GGTG_13779 [Gaeumannomyces tritici R3-111a-1]
MPPSSRNPTTWDEYERGGSPNRQGSVSSVGARSGRSVQFQEEQALLEDSDAPGDDGDGTEWQGRLRRRRSSVTMRLASIADIGGVNSMRSFTKSWQRAAGFAEVIPQRPSFVFAPDQAPTLGPANDIEYGRSQSEAGLLRPPSGKPGPSLLRQHLDAAAASPPGPEAAGPADHQGPASPTAADQQQQQSDADFRERERKALVDNSDLPQIFRAGGNATGAAMGRSPSIFAIPPHLATPAVSSGSDPYGGIYGGSYGSYRSHRSMSYGTIRSRDESPRGGTVSVAPVAGARGSIWGPPAEEGPDSEVQPILVKEVEQDGKVVLTVEGQSTLPQTIFNSINVLIGVGLLSLPMGIRYAGWLCGMGFLFAAAAVTAYTASLLTRCMDLDPSLITFSDLAFISFGSKARIATSILFTLELLAACVALIVLFADSLDLLFPGFLSVTQWKVACALILLPLHFMPLSLLSYSSIVGIFSCFCIVLIVVINGLIKPDSPGSLIQPAATYLLPANWLTLPLSFGLLMSPWGGHSVFPNIYRDMRHPYKYGQAVKVTFTFTYFLDAATAVAGILMFGDDVKDAITSNILTTPGYPRVLTFLMCAFIGIIPLTKIPLNARPIITTLEVLFGVYHQQQPVDTSDDPGLDCPPEIQQQPSASTLAFKRGAIRVLTIFSFLIISILFPAFDRIMAFMGSALCFSICVTLPIAFYLKLFGNEISGKEKTVAWAIMLTSALLSLVGTVWAFLPKKLILAQ